MTDLYVAIAAMAVLTGGIFGLGLLTLRRIPRQVALLALLATVAGLTFYLKHGQDHVLVAKLIPVTNAIILGNVAPLICAMAGVFAWVAIEGALWRRGLVATAIIVTGCIAAWYVVWDEQPVLRNSRVGPVWRQTSQASCSAAAAATLLNAHSIPASEIEMARLCLTTDQGTRTLGVYRGLKLKTVGTEYEVEPFSGSVEALLDFAVTPVVINVSLRPEDANVDSSFVDDWGWLPGVEHTVVLLGTAPNGHLVVADPAAGLEMWTMDALRILWHGEGFRLRRR